MSEIAAPRTLVDGWLFQHTTVSCATCAHAEKSRQGFLRLRWCPVLEDDVKETYCCGSWKVAITINEEKKDDHESAH